MLFRASLVVVAVHWNGDRAGEQIIFIFPSIIVNISGMLGSAVILTMVTFDTTNS